MRLGELRRFSKTFFFEMPLEHSLRLIGEKDKESGLLLSINWLFEYTNVRFSQFSESEP